MAAVEGKLTIPIKTAIPMRSRRLAQRDGPGSGNETIRAPGKSQLPPLSPARHVFAAIGIAAVFAGNPQTLFVPVISLVQADLDTDEVGITWALTISLIAAAVGTPLIGRAGDLFGKRRAFLFAVAVTSIGRLIAAVAPDLEIMLLAQLLQGIGGGVIYSLAYSLIRDSVPPDRVPAGIGFMTAILAGGGAIGTAVAGPLAELIGWRGLFLLPLPGVVIGVFLALRYVPESTERATGGINLLAALLLSAGLVALLVPLSSGSRWGWSSAPVIGLFFLAVVLLAGWVVVELRSREPLVDMRMMRLPGIWNANLTAVLMGVAMYGVWAFVARFAQEPRATGYGLGASVSEASFILAPLIAFLSIAGSLVRPLSRIAGPSVQVVAGAAITALSAASIAFFHSHIWMLAIEAGGFGLGLGLYYAAMSAVVVLSVPTTQTGVATGMNSNFRVIGNGIGTALMTAIVTGSADAEGTPTEAGYVFGFLVLAAAATVAATVSVLAAKPPSLSAASA